MTSGTRCSAPASASRSTYSFLPILRCRVRPPAIIASLTRLRPAFQVPGYTGFIPKIQNNFATTFTCASRVAMCCPPTPDLETIQTDFTRARRRLQTAACVFAARLPCRRDGLPCIVRAAGS